MHPRRYRRLAGLPEHRRRGHESLIRGGDSLRGQVLQSPQQGGDRDLDNGTQRRKQMETAFLLVQGCLRQLRKDRLYPGERKRGEGDDDFPVSREGSLECQECGWKKPSV